MKFRDLSKFVLWKTWFLVIHKWFKRENQKALDLLYIPIFRTGLLTWDVFYSGLEPRIPLCLEFLFKEKNACGMLLLQKRLCKHPSFAQDIQVHRKLCVTSTATPLSVWMLTKSFGRFNHNSTNNIFETVIRFFLKNSCI